VRKAERCEFKGEADNGEDDDRGGGETYETEAEAGQRRLTRSGAQAEESLPSAGEGGEASRKRRRDGDEDEEEREQGEKKPRNDDDKKGN
jgi:hypothetical protein